MPSFRLWLLACWIALPARADEPPAIERLFPPGGQTGTTVTAALRGKSGDGNLQVWSELQQVTCSFNEQKDKAIISIPEQATNGVHWLRFYNESGCTDLRPFFVGTAAELVETEPNNEPSNAFQVESLPATINGVLERSGDVDLFAVDLQAGQTLVASLQANRELGSPMDGVLELLDSGGTMIAFNDDDHGNDPLLIATVNESGRYFVRLYAFPAAPNSTIRLAGSKDYVYRLTITIGALEDHPTIEHLSVTENANALEPITIPWSITGRIEQPGEVDQFCFDAAPGQSVTVSVAAQSYFSWLDPIVVLRDPNGKVIKEFDDLGGNDPDVRFGVELPAGGTYSLTIKDRFGNGGQRYHYVASVDESKPGFTASVAVNSFVMPNDAALEIPVTIGRLNGFSERIEVSIAGLPEGLDAAAVYSEPQGDSSKKVTLKVQRGDTATAFSGLVRVVCVAEESKQALSASAPRPNSKQTISELWLTVTP